MSFLLHILSNSLAIYVAARFVQGISFSGDWKILLIAGVVIGVVSFLIKPLLKLLTFPLIVLSLGLFTIIINMFLLWLVDYLIDELVIEGLFALFLGTIIISAVNMVTSAITHKS